MLIVHVHSTLPNGQRASSAEEAKAWQCSAVGDAPGPGRGTFIILRQQTMHTADPQSLTLTPCELMLWRCVGNEEHVPRQVISLSYSSDAYSCTPLTLCWKHHFPDTQGT